MVEVVTVSASPWALTDNLDLLIPPQPEFAPRASGWDELSTRLRKNATCAFCLKSSSLEAHHLIPFHLRPSLELEPKNIVILCRWCHFVVGHLGNWSTFNPLVLRLIEDTWADAKSIARTGRPSLASIGALLSSAQLRPLGLSIKDIFDPAVEL